MRRTTHEAEIEFDLDPAPGDSKDRPCLTVYCAAEQTASGHQSSFNHITGDADPGGPAEFDIHTVQVYSHGRQKYIDIGKGSWEDLFGRGSWDNLMVFIEGELEKRI